MSSGPNGEHRYQLDISVAIARRLRRLQRTATRKGLGEEFLAAFRYAVSRLYHDPTRFGEPLYRLPALHLQIRCAAVGLLGIHFGVHEHRRIVFLQEVKLLP